MYGYLIAYARRLRTRISIYRARRFLTAGSDLHIGARCRLWAPDLISIGNGVYMGADVHIECNAEIGDYVMLANRVAFVGRHDHDFRALGIPVRYSPWVGSKNYTSPYRNEKVVIEADVWMGFSAIILSGVRIGRGAIVATGSVVTKDVPSYSIVAGSPARVVGQRFPDAATVQEHEARIRTGRFKFSERGYDYWIVEPGSTQTSAGLKS